MKDFLYCIWAIPANYHQWHEDTNGFCPHLSINTNLSYEEAYAKFTEIEFSPVMVTLETVVHEYTKEFSSLFYTADSIPKPIWFPDGAHISFIYQYSGVFSSQNIEHVERIQKNGLLDRICVVRCNGHYDTWEVLHMR